MSNGRSASTVDVIANQIFVGCPWKTVRPKFEQCIAALDKQYPLSFILVGRDDDQDAVDLLDLIQSKIRSSSAAIFDATGGNANVSLEYGFAEALNIRRVLYVSSHKASKKGSKDNPIIADIAGKRRNQYTQVARLKALLAEFAISHNYNKRFQKFITEVQRRSTAEKRKAVRTLALAVIHVLDNKTSMRRADLVQDVLGALPNVSEAKVDDMVRRLHSAQLIRCEPGRYSTVTIR